MNDTQKLDFCSDARKVEKQSPKYEDIRNKYENFDSDEDLVKFFREGL